MINPLLPFLAWLQRRKAARALREAERKRRVVMEQIEARRVKHREWKPLVSELRQATNASLRAGLVR